MDLRVHDVRRQSVAAQQQLVAALQLERERLGARRSALTRAERARDHVFVLVRMRFLGGYLADFDQPLHQRVILGDLAKRRSFHHVSPAVTDPRNSGVGGRDQRAYAGRTHSARLRMARHIFDNL